FDVASDAFEVGDRLYRWVPNYSCLRAYVGLLAEGRTRRRRVRAAGQCAISLDLSSRDRVLRRGRMRSGGCGRLLPGQRGRIGAPARRETPAGRENGAIFRHENAKKDAWPVGEMRESAGSRENGTDR
ncbi:MAG: hypothetical protein KAI66_15265, partial [Lentisphaeria bacterium]|nr:hypothetical protein [Lentisphaeria bacterium]